MAENLNQKAAEISRKARFKLFLSEDDKPQSNKSSSYIRAIDLVCEMIKRHPVGFGQIQNLWLISSSEKLESLYHFLLQESRNQHSIWFFDDQPVSYLRDGFCSAAIKQYHQFLVELRFEEALIDAYSDKLNLNGRELDLLEAKHAFPSYLTEELQIPEGKDKLQLVKQRINQSVFRSIIRKNYQGRCCITGLNIPAVNRASHIIGWAKDPSKRLDPRNGLYLSATYDAAFDRHLISLDDNYRIILSTELKEFHTQESFKQHFKSIEGKLIEVPLVMPPSDEYLAVHRKLGSFN